MSHSIVYILEAIEIEQHHRKRFTINCLLRQQPARTVDKSSPIGNTAQWVHHRVDLVLQFRAFLRHVEEQKRHEDRKQEGSESDQGKRKTAQ